MDINKQQTEITKLISTFKESIDYLESCLEDEDVTDETTRIRLRARLSQARYFLNYANEAKEMEKEHIEEAFANGVDDEYEYHVNNQPRKNTEDYYKETYE
jgi:hypothetical protein